jgi:recombination endonuclease VII
MMIDGEKRYTGPKYREIRTAYEPAYQRANRQQLNAAARRRRAVSPTPTPAKNRRALLRRYGLTEADFDRLSAGQDYVCALCRKAPRDRLCVDHCHDFKMLRSLLCRKCNRGLGAFDDNPALLRAAADYVEIWRIIHARKGPTAKPIRINTSKPKKRADREKGSA